MAEMKRTKVCKVSKMHGQAYKYYPWCVEVPGGVVHRFKAEDDARKFAKRIEEKERDG